ncbi:hypothetical protein [Actinopolyspora erythraea]|uniref:hypothetical protein n=1 Tax=Actinopolyspora erythraea TaxID=414996 RepID=UPI0011858A0F|nr:hypothetical protein [Actinopolyspora erythraea]
MRPLVTWGVREDSRRVRGASAGNGLSVASGVPGELGRNVASWPEFDRRGRSPATHRRELTVQRHGFLFVSWNALSGFAELRFG